MVSDSIANASIPSAAFSSKDLGKKKRARSAKLKQCKLDVRREQWLSQGTAKNKSSKAEPNFPTTTSTSTSTSTTVGTGNKENNNHHHHRPLGNLEIRVERVEETIGGGGGSSILHHHHHPTDSDSESLSNSPTSLASGGNDSGTNFTGSTSSRSSTSTSSSFGEFCSESVTDEDDDDEDGCLDDWEAVADALAAKDEQESQFPVPPPIPDPGHGAAAAAAAASPGRAWRPDDASRPQNLPNLSKQLSLPNSDRHQQQHQQRYTMTMMMPPPPVPSSCPICTEDLDFTDSSFFPCLCGFRLCLFCYKRIIEDDGRCPGCRKPYELNPAQVSETGFTFRLARSCSMITRS